MKRGIRVTLNCCDISPSVNGQVIRVQEKSLYATIAEDMGCKKKKRNDTIRKDRSGKD
jgi:hypothetical protein